MLVSISGHANNVNWGVVYVSAVDYDANCICCCCLNLHLIVVIFWSKILLVLVINKWYENNLILVLQNDALQKDVGKTS